IRGAIRIGEGKGIALAGEGDRRNGEAQPAQEVTAARLEVERVEWPPKSSWTGVETLLHCRAAKARSDDELQSLSESRTAMQRRDEGSELQAGESRAITQYYIYQKAD